MKKLVHSSINEHGDVVANTISYVSIAPANLANYNNFFVQKELLNEASTQYSIQQQAHALLQLCSEDNDVDEIEAERIILLAGI